MNRYEVTVPTPLTLSKPDISSVIVEADSFAVDGDGRLVIFTGKANDKGCVDVAVFDKGFWASIQFMGAVVK